jgi:hypothetical protein
MGKDAEQWIAATRSQERTARQNGESRRVNDVFNLSLHPFLYVGIPLHSRNRPLHPIRFQSAMYGDKQHAGRSQNSPETQKSLFDIAGTNVKEAERSPETVKACFRKFQIPHIHFFDCRCVDAFFCELYETLGQINGCYVVAQPRKSFGIHSRAAATVEDFRSGGQSLDKLLSFWFDELVRCLKVITVLFRAAVIGLFDVYIIRVLRLHFGHFAKK